MALVSRESVYIGTSGGELTHLVLLLLLLLLLGEHVRLLGLQVGEGMGVGSSHASRLHATHHRTCLTNGTIGTRDVLHTRRHSRLSWVWAWASHAWVRMRHTLWVHATIVRIARGHHLGASLLWAAASQSREKTWEDVGRAGRWWEDRLAKCR